MNRLFVLCAFVSVALLCGCAKKTETVTQSGFSLSQRSDGVMTVNAEIVEIRSSPDHSHVALILKQFIGRERDGNIMHYWVAIFDPVKKEIVAQNSEPARHWSDDLYWSPDGKWLAATNLGEQNGVLLLGIDGSTRQVVSGMHISDLVWREDVPGRFLYIRWKDPSVLSEYDIGTEENRTVNTDFYLLSLFNVNGKPYAAHRRGKSWEYIENDSIYIVQVDTWKERLRVPLYETSRWDNYMLELSPDGRFLFLRSHASGGARNVIARVEDAPEVFRKPHMAIMWQDAPEDGYEVLWPQTVGHREDSTGESLVLIRSLFGAFWVDLRTGNQQHWSSTPEALYVDWWKPAHSDSSKDPEYPEYLALTEDGLSVHEGSWNWLRPGSTMIKHKRQEN